MIYVACTSLPTAHTKPASSRARAATVTVSFLPLSVLLDLRADPAWRDVPEAARDTVLAYHRTMADWLRRCAAWVRSGAGAAEVADALPEPPGVTLLAAAGGADRPVAEHLAARAAWYNRLHRDVRAILDQVAPLPQPRATPPMRRIAVAAT